MERKNRLPFEDGVIMQRNVIFYLAVLLSVSTFSLAVDIFVPTEQPTIQAAIDVAETGDVVVVMPSDQEQPYTGPGNTNISFLGKGIIVRSANGPQDCVIDCQGTSRAFIFENSETDASRLEGFTITNGSEFYGGAIECVGASPEILI